MPLLDVSSLLFDPDFADSFNVRRRIEVIDTHGRVSTQETVYEKVVGVITANSPSDLDRRDNYQNMSRSISVVTKFNLLGETSGKQPDVVVWQGSNYIVKHIGPYPSFGAGFMQAECSSMDKQDLPFTMGSEIIGQLIFTSAGHSDYAALM